MPIDLTKWHPEIAWAREDIPISCRSISIEKVRRKAKSEKVKPYTFPYMIKRTQESPTVTAIVNEFVDSVKQLPKLCAVFFKCADEQITLWTVIEHLDFETEYAICRSENRIARKCQEFTFDFLTLPRNGKSIYTVVPKDLNIIHPRSER